MKALMGIVLLNCCVAWGATLATASAAEVPNGTGPEDAIVIDDSWRLLLDEHATWKNDKLYLPDEVDLLKLPVNAPTGGWRALNDEAGIPVSLPGTVEEHYWNKRPLPVADPASLRRIVELSSSYAGVSWWYRTFDFPALKPGERLIFSFPGARLRAEVYVNGILVGYNLISEIPFTADATRALKHGERNQLAVRITNPGGTLSWGDFNLQTWGSYRFPVSHNFGGIDAGVSMSVRAPVEVEDLYVANLPDPRSVTLNADVESSGPAYDGLLEFTISRNGIEVWHGSAPAKVPGHGRASITLQATVSNAELWDIGHPNLYRATASIPGREHSARITDFGFRWLNAEGIGQNPRLVLNGRRIFISSAISWGYWAPNGMFPDKEAVQREVDAVRALGMNAVQNHRHFPKAAVLDGFDHAGLLRYCEPGGGSAIWDETEKRPAQSGPIDPSGIGGEPVTFANRYELAKLIAMVKAYRSHPSVFLWSLNNETGSGSHNAKMFFAMRKVQEVDPSRMVVLKSGFGPEGEIMAHPYSSELSYGEAATGHDSGWHDNHNEEDTGVYQDSLYINPRKFKTFTEDKTGIAMWGELGTANSPDDDAAAVKWYSENKKSGYNFIAATERLKAYEEFLDKYHFREAFPTAENLFQAVGSRHYFAASHIVENARIADANDYIALTGWESTTIDNNSGLVDSLRHLKADPALMRQANAPELLVVRPRHYVLAIGERAEVDAYAVNQVNRRGSYTLHFKVAMDATPDRPFYETSVPVSLSGGDTFAQLLQENIGFTSQNAGPATMTASLVAPGEVVPAVQRKEPILFVDSNKSLSSAIVAVADYDGSLAPALKKQFGLTAIPLSSAPKKVDTILLSSAGTPRLTWTARAPERLSGAKNTEDPDLYSQQYRGQRGGVVHYSGLSRGDLKVELFFAEPKFDVPGKRVFDVAINGQVVLDNFDIESASGGKSIALVKAFKIKSPDGKLDISVPKVEQGEPLFAAIRITDLSGHVVRQVFRKDTFHDAGGMEWQSATNSLIGFDWDRVLPSIIDRVKSGSRLVVLGADTEDASQAAQALAKLNLVSHVGKAGYDDTPWIGHWYFARKHWLLDGLPSDCVLDWQYQAAAPGDGLMFEAPQMEAVIAYGKNPSPGFGFGAAVFPVSKGQVVLFAMGGLSDAFLHGDPKGFQPVVAKRILYNALAKK